MNDQIEQAGGKSETLRAEIEAANKYMLIGIRWLMNLIGIAGDGLLTKFIEQEFQAWVQRVENPTPRPQHWKTAEKLNPKSFTPTHDPHVSRPDRRSLIRGSAKPKRRRATTAPKKRP